MESNLQFLILFLTVYSIIATAYALIRTRQNSSLKKENVHLVARYAALENNYNDKFLKDLEAGIKSKFSIAEVAELELMRSKCIYYRHFKNWFQDEASKAARGVGEDTALVQMLRNYSNHYSHELGLWEERYRVALSQQEKNKQ